jgi:hypothetical protein
MSPFAPWTAASRSKALLVRNLLCSIALLFAAGGASLADSVAVDVSSSGTKGVDRICFEVTNDDTGETADQATKSITSFYVRIDERVGFNEWKGDPSGPEGWDSSDGTRLPNFPGGNQSEHWVKWQTDEADQSIPPGETSDPPFCFDVKLRGGEETAVVEWYTDEDDDGDGTHDILWKPVDGGGGVFSDENDEDFRANDDDDAVANADEHASDPDNPDTDGDGTQDGDDNCPQTPNEDGADADDDGAGDACDPDPEQPDADGDGLEDGYEMFALGTEPLVPDTDGDGVGDGDEIAGLSDALILESVPEVLLDGVDNDGFGLVDEDFDVDRDGIENLLDNCPDVINPNQADADGDGEGELCDLNDRQLYFVETRDEYQECQRDEAAVSYNLYRGSLAVLRDTGDYSQEPGSNPYAEWFCARAEPAFDDGLWPLSGEAFFWLCTANDEAGFEFGPGEDSRGVERPIWDGGSCGAPPPGDSPSP